MIDDNATDDRKVKLNGYGGRIEHLLTAFSIRWLSLPHLLSASGSLA